MPKEIALDSEQTIYQASETHQLIVEALKNCDQGLVLDLAQISDVDSSFVQILIWLQNEGLRRNQWIQLRNPSTALKDVIAQLGLLAVFPSDFGVAP